MYKDLKVYQKSYRLAISLYRYTGTLPAEERYGLTSQIRRASMSIPLNIAEGFGKCDSNLETNRFLKISKGSCNELEVLIDFCKDFGYMDEKSHHKYQNEISEIGKMLHGLGKSLKKKD